MSWFNLGQLTLPTRSVKPQNMAPPFFLIIKKLLIFYCIFSWQLFSDSTHLKTVHLLESKVIWCHAYCSWWSHLTQVTTSQINYEDKKFVLLVLEDDKNVLNLKCKCWVYKGHTGYKYQYPTVLGYRSKYSSFCIGFYNMKIMNFMDLIKKNKQNTQFFLLEKKYPNLNL